MGSNNETSNAWAVPANESAPMDGFEVVDLEANRDFTVEQPHVTVEYKNLRFKVNKRDGSDIVILKGLSGVCRPGRLLSIMGPSGAGKTTLLDVLAGNIFGGTVEGTLIVNGSPTPPKEMKHLSCYVMQNPVLLSSATVRESLMTSTLLRLPLKIPNARKVALVNQILEELGLTECADVLIGNEVEAIKGISGGEKRRLAVGVELVTQPSVILLDEPTSGLDSEIALTIMKTLRNLAAKGRTVVCTIHQPNSDIVETFDDFALLANGKNMYFGAWKGAVDFFAGAGYKCPIYKNPTDYFMSVAKNNEAVAAIATAFSSVEQEQSSTGGFSDDGKGLVPALALSRGRKPTHVPGWFQTVILWQRFLLTWKRHPMLFGAEFTQYVFIGVFIGLMYLQVTDGLANGVFDRYAAQFFCLVAIVFTPAFSAATLWDNERLLIRVETARNAYQLGPYFVAKTLTTWPMEIFFCLLFSVVTYFMIGFQAGLGKFFTYFGVIVLFQLISESMGLLAAVSTPKAAYAVLLLSLIFLPLLSFTGFIVRDIPVYFDWIRKIAYINFATAALVLTEFKGATFTLGNGTRTISGDVLLGDEPLDDSDAELVRATLRNFDNGLSVGMNMVVLLAMLVILRVMTYISLKISAKYMLL
ncbi:hypothetical protein BSKO_05252 [Bryopsis sp. KO-2023]|nr:hypothetical protein BSKO_05252 [Bryopsis sp. KO-2023]